MLWSFLEPLLMISPFVYYYFWFFGKNKGIDANKLIKEISKLIKGGGGGQAFYATAGGNDKNGLQEAIALAKDLIFNK